MKRTLKTIFLAMILAVSLAFVGCFGGLSQSDADKINAAAENGEPMMMGELKDKYGEPYSNKSNSGYGWIVWISCDAEDYDTKTENGEKISALVVTFTAYQAISAEYIDNYNNVPEQE